jgi:phage-related protein
MQTLRVQIVGDTTSYQRSLKQAGQETKRFSGSIASWVKGAVVFTAVEEGAQKVTEALKTTFEAGLQAQEQNDKLTQAMKNVGSTMTATSKPILALEKDSRKLGFANTETRDAMLKLIQAKKPLTELTDAQNLARASGQSLSDATTGLIRLQAGNTRAAKQYGIVLPPVTKNVDALKKSGEDLSTTQGKQDLAMAKVQDKLATGQAYYDALSGKVKNQAKVFSESAAGGIAQFHAGIKNLEEIVGGKLVAGFQIAQEHIGKIIGIFGSAGSWTDKLTKSFESLGVSAGTSQKIVDVISQTFDKLKGIFEGVVTAVEAVWGKFGDVITNQVKAVWGLIKSTIQNDLKIIQGIIDVFAGIFTGDWSRVWNGVKEIFSGVWNQIQALVKYVFETIKNLLTAYGRVFIAAWSAIWEGVKAGAAAAWDGIKSVLTSAWNAIKGAATSAWNGIVGVITTAKNTVVGLFTTIGHAIGSKLQEAWDLSKTGALQAVAAIVEPFSHLPGSMGGWARKIKDNVNAELDKITAAKAAAKIISDFRLGINPASAAGRDIGAAYMTGIAAGIGVEEASAMAASVAGINKVLAAGRTAAKAKSPSQVTMELGKDLMAGLTLGIVSGATKAIAAMNSTVTSLTKTVGSSIAKGLGDAAPAIIAAAKKVGVDARAALAVAMSEGGTKFGAVGDKGTSFGPFQLHIGGANPYGDPKKAAEFANSLNGITYALEQMAKAGASGKTGYDAIAAIVRNFERPADPSGEIRRAIDYYKQLPGELGKASVAVATQTGASVNAAVTAAGADLAKNIKALLDAQAAKVKEAQGTFKTAFGDLANAALAAFDKKMEDWKPPSSILLQKLQLQDQLNQLTSGLGPAVNEAEQRLAAAFESGNKQAIDQAQSDLDAALTNSFNAVDANTTNMLNAAQATLAQAQAEGDPDKVATAQAAYDQALTDRTTSLNQNIADQRALVEQNLTYRADAEQRTHDAIAAKQREGLAKQLAQLQTWLLQHPKKWAEMAGKVQAILNDPKYKITLEDSGHAWANKFAAGVTAGIPAAVKAAQALAKAVAAELPSKNSPLKPAQRGPLAFHPYDMGKDWATALGSGLTAGGLPAVMAGMTQSGGVAFSGSSSSGIGGTPSVVNVYVSGTVVTENQLVDAVYRGLVRKSGRNAGNLGLA